MCALQIFIIIIIIIIGTAATTVHTIDKSPGQTTTPYRLETPAPINGDFTSIAVGPND